MAADFPHTVLPQIPEESEKSRSSQRLAEPLLIDGLRQWEPLEVLPDTPATATLAQLTIVQDTTHRKISLCGVPKKILILEENKLKRSTSLDWSEKLCKVKRTRCPSEIDALATDAEIEEFKMSMKKAAAEARMNKISELPDEMDSKGSSSSKESDHVDGSKQDSSSDCSSISCELVFSYNWDKPKKIAFACTPPCNWLYEDCETDEHFERKWEAIANARQRQTVTVVKKRPANQRRQSIDSFAKKTMQTAGHYFLNLLKSKKVGLN